VRRRWRIRADRDGRSIAADVNLAITVNNDAAGARAAQASRQTKGDEMTDEAGFKPLTREELDELAGEQLPERAAMSLLNANVAIPINAAVAANVLSDNATSVADAAQSGQLDQIS
jgi:hypothetical protein